MVTVAPAVFENGTWRLSNETADYYCTGADDDLIINAAIQFVSSAYGGGTVHLLEGTFNLSNYLDILSNVNLNGSGMGTIIIGVGTTSISSIGTAGAHRSGCGISNMKMLTPYTIEISYSDAMILRNVQFINPIGANYTIYVQNADAFILDQCIFDGNLISTANSGAVYCNLVTNSKITNNTFKSYRISGGSFFTIYIDASTAIQIISNSLYDISDATNGSNCRGILTLGNYGIIANNKIELIKNTGAGSTAIGLRIDPNAVSNSVSSNYCYNNGSDTGIANTNGNNFSDAGTDTQVYSNSWQSPVASEPSLGTLHYDAYQFSAVSYLNATPTFNTFYTVTISGLPAGVKAVWITGYTSGATAAAVCVWRPYGSSDTAAQSQHRQLGIVPSANGYGALCGWVTVDSSGRFDIATNITNTTIQVNGDVFYDV